MVYWLLIRSWEFKIIETNVVLENIKWRNFQNVSILDNLIKFVLISEGEAGPSTGKLKMNNDLYSHNEFKSI